MGNKDLFVFSTFGPLSPLFGSIDENGRPHTVIVTGRCNSPVGSAVRNNASLSGIGASSNSTANNKLHCSCIPKQRGNISVGDFSHHGRRRTRASPPPPIVTSTVLTRNASGASPGCSSSTQSMTVCSVWPAASAESTSVSVSVGQSKIYGTKTVRMRTRKPETAEIVRRNDLRSVARVEGDGVVTDASIKEGGSEGRANSCLRILAPIRVLGRERGEGVFAKVGAICVEFARNKE